MNFTEAAEYLEQAKKHGIVPGLDSIRRLLEKLGDPQKDLKFVHIAGTNGKGSVSAYVACALRCGGYRAGRFLSPHLNDDRDMIQVNGTSISGKAFGQCMDQVKEACEKIEEEEGAPPPTVFEIQTALGFLYFREKKCDIVILEAGMGGLEDATNVVENTLAAVITRISRDHMKFLGDTLPKIAAQKAGIIKKGCHVVVMEQEPEDAGQESKGTGTGREPGGTGREPGGTDWEPEDAGQESKGTGTGREPEDAGRETGDKGQAAEVMGVISRRAEELGCPLTVVHCREARHVRYGLEKQSFDYKGYKRLEIGLAGKYQIDNALLALEVLDALAGKGFPLAEERLRRGMAEAKWPGRFTILGKKPWFIADGAHNEDGARRLAQSLEQYFPGKRILYIMGVLQDKEYEKMIALTHSLADQIITVTPPENPRALPAYLLARELAGVHGKVTAADSLEEAVEMAYLLAGKEDVIVAFGSLSFMGRILKIAEHRRRK